MNEQPFKIPKLCVPIVCQTIQGEIISGEIFLDLTSSEGYSFQQILDFFNDEPSFFPIRTSDSPEPILLRKENLAKIDLPPILLQIEQESSAGLMKKKEALVHMPGAGILTALIFLDVPGEYARILDLVNRKKTFFPAIVDAEMDAKIALLNSHHVYKIEEL